MPEDPVDGEGMPDDPDDGLEEMEGGEYGDEYGEEEVSTDEEDRWDM